jgi:hypothetical protein
MPETRAPFCARSSGGKTRFSTKTDSIVEELLIFTPPDVKMMDGERASWPVTCWHRVSSDARDQIPVTELPADRWCDDNQERYSFYQGFT